ncbi:fumble [Neocallimastix lanati (nom. inval.)]|jgi:type II pantothenate kinase|uniref:pantothenate kinase n=1 Tax=Neocallimastix californiae TaxID=1754190 RepID=A0A1Y2FE22_9FUNG|nr:fumble [Neocallimastix sp. JGI-2020a]ORY82188.1 fumble [Neocallimastix californiae]|eukprot:ORY82188.1 fumble [Neocallimastix californiae]
MPTLNKPFSKFTSKSATEHPSSSTNNEIVNEAIKHQYNLKSFARTLENYEDLAELDTKQYSLDSLFAMDIGGSLAKIIFYDCNSENFENTELKELFNNLKDNIFSTEDYGFSGIRDRYKSIKTKNGCIHFILFETQRIKNAVELIFQNDIIKNIKQISCTGGGSYKFEEYFRENYDIEIKKYDEFKSLLAGLNTLLKYSPNESYHYKIDDTINDSDKPIPDVYDADAKSIFPYLLVNVGSGVSVLHVKDENTFERVSGSGIGGATFSGLVRALTNISSFDEALQASRVGNSANVNMLVGDIYGGEYQSFNLPAEMVASFFGKFAKNDTMDKASDADICNALLVMITNNVGQVAYLNAMRYNLSRIYFSGNFLRSNVIAMKALAKAIHFWSHGEIQAHFLKHEGYFGALGTFFLNNLSQAK